MRVHRIGLAALAAVCAVASSAWAQDAPVTLIHRPQLGPAVDTAPRPVGTGFPGMDAFPRLSGASPTVARTNAALDRADAGMLRAIEAAHALNTASPAGSYTKHDKGNATLTMIYRGGRWDAVIAAGGIPRGGATAADCNFTANGQMRGNSFEGQVVRDDGVPGLIDGEPVAPGAAIAITFAPDAATITEAKVFDLCGTGVMVPGRYPRERTP